jgi:thiol-disulfide isomerase/thioredoxin
MKKGLIIIFSVILVNIFLTAQEKKVYKDDYFVKTGDQAPEFIINEAGGKSYKLSDLRGKVVMLQFTASWCSVCRKDILLHLIPMQIFLVFMLSRKQE